MNEREKLCVEGVLSLMAERDIRSLAKTVKPISTEETSLEGK
jgi:hypothetical protein